MSVVGRERHHAPHTERPDMFHGTDHSDLDLDESNPSSTRDDDLCLTPDWEAAERFANRWGGPGYVYEIEGLHNLDIAEGDEALRELGFSESEIRGMSQSERYTAFDTYLGDLADMGYDAVRYTEKKPGDPEGMTTIRVMDTDPLTVGMCEEV